MKVKIIKPMIKDVEQHLQKVADFVAQSPEQLEAFRLDYLGKKGVMNQLFASFKNVPKRPKKRIWSNTKSIKTKCTSKH
jgi:phenylalanyl-tRNA synthetase alpha chain